MIVPIPDLGRTSGGSVKAIVTPKMEGVRVGALCLLAHLICLNYFLLRSIKDALVVTAHGGASIIPILKVWALLPIFALTALFSMRVVRAWGHRGLTIIVLGGFTFFFFIAVHLPLPVFYIGCELWRMVALTMVFWGFVSLRSDAQGATWQFPLYLISGSLSALVSSALISFLLTTSHWQGNALFLVGVLSLFALLLYLLLSRGERLTLPPRSRGSFPAIFRSKLLPWLGVLIVGEYILLQIVEVLWKEQIYQIYPNPADYCAYQSRVISWIGIIGMGATLFSPLLLKRFSWRKLLFVTPLLGIVLALFFPLAPLLIGAFHNVLFRASRQAFADPSRELAYLTLDDEAKMQGKAFICSLSPPIGKVLVALIFLAL